MKKIFYGVLIFSSLFYSCGTVVYTYTEQPVRRTPPVVTVQPATDQVFYDELEPYGQWIDFPDYGYVWKPNVGGDFRPYSTNGQWAYTTEGWIWVSDYSWGWAPFHYGRWFYDDYYGWLWLPGHQWAPAWVTWGQSGGYYGWAPIPPRADINNGWRPRDNDWCYVRAEHINQNHVNNYIVQNNYNVVHNTIIINNNYSGNNNRNPHPEFYSRGPSIVQVQSNTNIKIQQITINNRTNPGQTTFNNNSITVYRPSISGDNQQNNNKPAPQHFGGYRQDNNPQQQSREWNSDSRKPNAVQVNGWNNPNQAAQPANPPVNNNPVVQPSQNTRQGNGWNNPNQVSQPANPPINNNPVVQPSQNTRQGNGWNNPNQVSQPANPPVNNNPTTQPPQNPRQGNVWNNPNQVSQPANPPVNNGIPNNQNPQNNFRNAPVQQPQRPAQPQWNFQKQQAPQQGSVQQQTPANNPPANIISTPPKNVQQNSPGNPPNNQPTATPARIFVKPNPKPSSVPPPKQPDNKKPPVN